MPPLFFALLAVIFLGSIPRAVAAPPAAEDAPVRRVADPLPAVTGKVVTAKLALTGMTCQGCAETIARLLVSIEGVRSAEVDLKARTGVVQFDDAKVKPARLVAKVVANGYGATISAETSDAQERVPTTGSVRLGTTASGHLGRVMLPYDLGRAGARPYHGIGAPRYHGIGAPR